MTADWGIPDPAAVQGTDEEKRKAFFSAYNQLHNRLLIFTNLPLTSLDKLSLQEKLQEIGKLEQQSPIV